MNRNSAFYNRRLYKFLEDQNVAENIEYIENPIPKEKLDKVYCKSSEVMDEIPDNSVHLMITSPPYNVMKEYDRDLSLREYRDLLRAVFRETYKKLVPGGRACVNIANIGRKPRIPLHAYIIEDMIEIGFLVRGEIIWNKGSSAGSLTSWGSWRSANNPVLRDVHEYILVFSKESFSRNCKNKETTITANEFIEFTKSIWNFPAVSAKRIGHPAPFPEELPHRLIRLYTFRDDIVLDPFCGSGTTCIAALKNERHYIGYDVESSYVELAEQRIEKARNGIKTCTC